MESRSWLLVAASHGGLRRRKGTHGGVTTPKMGRRRAWWWHWESEHRAGVLQGGGEGIEGGGPHRVCSSQVTPGLGAFSKWPWSLWSRRMPPEETPPQETRENPPQHHSHCLSQNHPLLLYSVPPGIWYNGGFVPCVTSGFPPLTVQLPGRQNQFGKHIQSLKTRWDQWLGSMSPQFRWHQARGHLRVPIPGTHLWE